MFYKADDALDSINSICSKNFSQLICASQVIIYRGQIQKRRASSPDNLNLYQMLSRFKICW